MRKGKKMIAMLLALLVFISGVKTDVFAIEQTKEKDSLQYVNPVYSGAAESAWDNRINEGVIFYVEAKNPKLRSSIDTNLYLENIEDVAQELRHQMTKRQTEAVVYMQMEEYVEDDMHRLIEDIFYKAMMHTGVPTEGDYLKFVWENFGCTVDTVFDGEKYYSTFNYQITYYTNLQQEEELDAAIQKLKDEWDLEGKSDYEIIKEIYGYITKYVRYDYAHLNDESYKLQFTAYAALINGTAVCQGYSTLFYRLALEYGVDARIIHGVAGDEAHSWNIVKLGEFYYNLDATWDAEKEGYDYFLKNDANFVDHVKEEEYCSKEFASKYVIGTEDYKADQTIIETEDFVFAVENHEVTVLEYKGVEKSVTIPEKIEGYTVTKIGNMSFADNDVVQKIIIPSTVKSIEDASVDGTYGAFYQCDNLLEVVFEKDSVLTHIGKCAFMGSSRLEKIVLPNSVKVLALSSFEGCRSIKEINLPEGLTEVQQNALSDTGITNLHIPSTCVSYHMWIDIPYLEEITVAEGNPVYRSHEGVLYFWDEEGWQLLHYPCLKKEETYRVADFATSIYADNLGYNENHEEMLLKKLYIGDCYGVSFDPESSMSKARCMVIPDETNPFYKLENDILLSKDGKTVEQIPKNIVGTLVLPEGVEKIVCYAGEHMKMQEIIFPESLKEIGAMAFYMCESLTSLAIPANLKKYDVSAFWDCYSLNEIYYGGSEEEWEQLIDENGFGFYGAQVKYNDDSFCKHDFEVIGTGSGLKYKECRICGYKKSGGTEIENPMENTFIDVPSSAYYYKPVLWAVDQGITAGVEPNQFAPDESCTRAQAVTFLYRLAGKPSVDGISNPFTDLDPNAFYYNAVLWAVDQGITNGITATTFEPNSTCTRGQIGTFIWRMSGKETVRTTEHPFTDVESDAYYYKAMLWAVENGITNGTTATTFEPNSICTRGQIVTFLYRGFAG